MSVRLSVTRRYSVEMVQHIIKLFSPSGWHNIFTLTLTLWQYSDGDPLTGALNAEGMKNRDFRPTCRYLRNLPICCFLRIWAIQMALLLLL